MQHQPLLETIPYNQWHLSPPPIGSISPQVSDSLCISSLLLFCRRNPNLIASQARALSRP